ncbi:MAG: amidohydrolase family protein, partial [Roseibium sp.]|nr:amidohydrolase family protein [Roseibium sp.]
MSTLIRGCTIITMDESRGSAPFTGDILIKGDRIAGIGELENVDAETVIDGKNRLAIPGLVNAHLHSGEALFKGRYDNLPLELWMLYAYPPLGAQQLTDRMIYLRTMLVAIESLKTGVTSVVDDVFEFPSQRIGSTCAVFDAYADSGLRATVSSNIMDKKVLDTIPFTREVVPQRLQDEVDAPETPTIDGYLAFCKEIFERQHGREGRLRYMIAPSAPQRCTADMLLACDEIARARDVPFHTHIVETKVQGVTGPEFYGKTLIQYLHDLGILGPNVAIAHSIWVTDQDIELMGDAGVSIIHNAISNQKLGAGIAPFRKLLNGGVNVALGSDGICSNDTPRMFDVMHAAGL